MSSRSTCAACSRSIDEWAKVCPYCGANPQTGERIDTQTLLQEIFKPREVTTSASVLEYARQRQGAVIGGAAFVIFLIIAGLHQFATMRNQTAVTDAPAVPLSELTDMTKRPDEAAPQPLPDLAFQYDGRPQTMRTYIIEPGATTPPEVIAAQQAEAAEKAAKAAASKPPAAGAQPAPVAGQPGAVQPQPGVRPGVVQPQPGVRPGVVQPQPGARPGVVQPQPGIRPGVVQPARPAGAAPVAPRPQPTPPQPR
ncbi:MAG TPA: hypothetical protein VE010_08495 [Thermoanaerobaculia bacterium]|nr:hypothetical protein [Thermoanaerobaculia bacterium]